MGFFLNNDFKIFFGAFKLLFFVDNSLMGNFDSG
jgi:hypothetical protein